MKIRYIITLVITPRIIVSNKIFSKCINKIIYKLGINTIDKKKGVIDKVKNK